jgi:catechol 2,3-dioxygenase-like lactoylglutathione lyase family enzyme
MSRYVGATEQLVTEIFVKDIRRSLTFYQELGFALLRDAGDFVELTWEDHRLFLTELSAVRDAPGAALPPSSPFPLANVRVMVPNVDEYWERAMRTGARIITPLADRYYGLRDFTIADPDGFGVRFATTLQAKRGD